MDIQRISYRTTYCILGFIPANDIGYKFAGLGLGYHNVVVDFRQIQ